MFSDNGAETVVQRAHSSTRLYRRRRDGLCIRKHRGAVTPPSTVRLLMAPVPRSGREDSKSPHRQPACGPCRDHKAAHGRGTDVSSWESLGNTSIAPAQQRLVSGRRGRWQRQSAAAAAATATIAHHTTPQHTATHDTLPKCRRSSQRCARSGWRGERGRRAACRTSEEC
jgi:hypothetical protein